MGFRLFSIDLCILECFQLLYLTVSLIFDESLVFVEKIPLLHIFRFGLTASLKNTIWVLISID